MNSGMPRPTFYQNKSIVYSDDTIIDYLMATVLFNRTDYDLSTRKKLISVLTDKEKTEKFLDEVGKENIVMAARYGYYFINSTLNEGFVILQTTYNNTEFEIYGSYKYIKKIEGIIKSLKFDTTNNYITWYYGDRGYSEKIPITFDKLPFQEMYPFLDKPLSEYYNDYMKSSSSVLLLIGPPGTGKTSFIKGLLNHTKESATLSYDTRVLDDDNIFVNFIAGSDKFFIIEDCDDFLFSREKGNQMMHRFLNVSDGLVSVKGKKLIFTTNLESVNDIDKALIRAGRCYDIINFDYLSYDEAKIIAKKFNIELRNKYSQYTIGDIFENNIDIEINRKIGF